MAEIADDFAIEGEDIPLGSSTINPRLTSCSKNNMLSSRALACNLPGHPRACLPSSEWTSDILRSLFLPYGFEDDGFDLVRFAREPQVAEHHRRGQYRTERIRQILARNRRR